jgi:hypothetical protein
LAELRIQGATPAGIRQWFSKKTASEAGRVEQDSNS